MRFNQNLKVLIAKVLSVALFCGLLPTVNTIEAKAEEIVKEINIDGTKVDEYNRFKGFGTVTCNNTSRLLLDYKEENPEKYWEIMNELFNSETGAGLTHIKVELGADVNSSSGTEPATMRYSDEPANVVRGAGFHFAADAKKINPNISVEILRWGEPRWTWNLAANKDYEARYQWYKQTIDAFYEEFGYRIDYVGISQNERAQNNGKNEIEWLKYFTAEIKKEPNYTEDYESIKIVAADGYRDTKTISSVLLNNPDLIDEIDVISCHYGLTGSNELTQLQNRLVSEGKQPKEVWISEGIAPMINARYRENMEPNRNGLGGTAGIVDVVSRVMLGYSWTGAGSNPLNAVSFDFQPSVAAFYEGASYNPKHLISAFDPWSGFYEIDGGIQGVRQVMNFVGQDDHDTEENERWMILNEATYNDGSFSDGGVGVDSSTHNYMTMKDPETDDYTTVFANNTSQTRKYKINASNLSGKENEKVYLWETRGPESGQSYDENWMKNMGEITPEDGIYTVEVKPYSILTITTLDKSGIKDFEYQSNSMTEEKLKEDTILPLPYTDDFEYDEYALDEKGRDYVDRRGGTPRYTTDQNAAFEVVKEATKQAKAGSAEREDIEIPDAEEHGNMLQQMITHDNIGADWAVWGGTDGSASSSNPNTTLGDFRWTNYKASYDFLLDTHTTEISGRSNYALIGVRQVKAGGTDSHATYNARVYSDGKYEILKLGKVVKLGTIENFDKSDWHNLGFEARKNIFTLYLDNKIIDSYTDNDSTVMAGRITIGTGFYETLIDNLRVDPIEGYSYESDKYDSAQGKVYESEEAALANNDSINPIGYVGNWTFQQSGYAHYNRTLMRTDTNFPVWNGVTVTHKDSTTQSGVINKVYYQGSWGSNDANAWGNTGTSMEIQFKGTAVNLYGIRNPSNGKGEVYLDGNKVADIDYINNYEINELLWSSEELTDGNHVLKVVSKQGYISFSKAEITTTDKALSTIKLAPTSIVKIADEAQVGNAENTVYAIRKNGQVWGSQTSNAWANFNDSPALVINFTGSGIDYLAGAGAQQKYNFELDGQDVGNFGVNTSTGVMYSVRNLEQKAHTLKVSLKDNQRIDTFMDYKGANVYYTVDPDTVKTSSFIFNFNGTGFNLFGNTPDALLDVYVDNQLVNENTRVYSKGDRQTSYYIHGLSDKAHTAKVVVKGGSFVLDGIDVITGVDSVNYVNTSDLQKLYDDNKSKEKEKYTNESWSVFEEALTNAKDVLENVKPVQEEVDAAKTNLENAIKGLVELYTSITPGAEWKDAEGNLIEAHGGSVQKLNEKEINYDIDGDGKLDKDYWFWYGEDKTNSTRPVDGVKCYISEDLLNWKDMGTVLPMHNNILPVKAVENKLEFDVSQLNKFKELANLTEANEEYTQKQIDDAKYFVKAYVTEWEDEEKGIAKSYDEDSLRLAFERLYGRYNISERPKMLYNKQTKKFVIAFHSDSPTYDNETLVNWVKNGARAEDTNTGSRYGRAEIGFAVSDTPFGPFKLVNSTRMNWKPGLNDNRKGESRDMTMFVDYGHDVNNDGVDDAYAIYSSEMNSYMYVSLLNSEYTGPSIEGGEAKVGEDFSYRMLPDKSREASSVFYNNGYYYMLTSGTDGWNSTEIVYYRSKSMITAEGETWEKVGNPCIGVSFTEKGFDSQPTSIITVDSEKGQYIYMGDRWKTSSNGSAGPNSRYVWLPIQVKNDNTIAIEYYENWNPNSEILYTPLTTSDKIEVNAKAGEGIEKVLERFPKTTNIKAGDKEFTNINIKWQESQITSALLKQGEYKITGLLEADEDNGYVNGRVITVSFIVREGQIVDLGYQGVVIQGGNSTNLPKAITIDGSQYTVEWDNTTFNNAYETVSVNGIAKNNGEESQERDIKAKFEVIPNYLVYFIDSGTGTSPIYDVISKNTTNLINKTNDQIFNNENAWGYVNNEVSVKASTDINEKYSTGLYAKTDLSYKFTLSPGTYTITAGFNEWWSVTRSMDQVITYKKNETEKTVNGERVDLSKSKNQAVSSTSFTIDENTVVTYTLKASSGSPAPIISWIAINKDDGVEVNKDELLKLYNDNKDKAQGNYTEESWNEFIAARDNVKAVLENEEATQEEVNAAKAELEEAVKALEEKVVIINKDELQKLYNDNKDKAQGNYTEESWNAFIAVRDNVKAVLENEEATQEQVDAAKAELEEALKALKEKDKSSNNSGNNNGDNGTNNEGSVEVDLPETGGTNPTVWLLVSSMLVIIGSIFTRKNKLQTKHENGK